MILCAGRESAVLPASGALKSTPILGKIELRLRVWNRAIVGDQLAIGMIECCAQIVNRISENGRNVLREVGPDPGDVRVFILAMAPWLCRHVIPLSSSVPSIVFA
jgi:hypothetical protein